jgi:flavin-dependent dehydrogenase
MEEIDLLIIGSGPAGLSLALHLVQLDSGWGKRIVLVEKASHPRPKLCAGGVTRIGLETLRHLGLDLPLPIPGVEVEEARMTYQDRQIKVRRKPVFVVYNRIEFDNYLSRIVRERGIRLRENEAVQAMNSTEYGIEVETNRDRYLAQVVVGADGSKGYTRRYLSQAGSQARVARLLETVVPTNIAHSTNRNSSADFDFTWCESNLQGYYWKFPSLVEGQPHFNHGVYDSRMAANRPRAALPEILTQSRTQTGSTSADVQIQGHPVLCFNPARRISSSRFLAVGDAAGVDPLFGEGIGPALAYGRIAAREIEAAFASGDFSFKGYRLHLLSSPLGRYLIIRWLIAWISYQLSWSPVYMHALWTLGKLAAAVWKEKTWFYPLKSPAHERGLKRQQGT